MWKKTKKKLLKITLKNDLKVKVDDYLYTHYHKLRHSIDNPELAAQEDDKTSKPSRNGSLTHETGESIRRNSQSNRLLLQYIRFIYKQYGIKDPVQPRKPENTNCFCGHSQINQTQIFLSNHQSFSSPKNRVIYSPKQSSKNLSQEKCIKLQGNQRYVQFAHPKLVCTTFSRQMGTYVTPKKPSTNLNLNEIDHRSHNLTIDTVRTSQSRFVSPNPRSSVQVQGTKSVRLAYTDSKTLNASQMNSGIEKLSHRFLRPVQTARSKQTESMRSTTQSVKQSYRYCLACESPILQANIQFHEQHCQEFKLIYNQSIEEFLAFLQNKIDHIKEKLLNVANKLADSDPLHMKKYSSNVGMESAKICREGPLTQHFAQNYNQAMRISSNWCITAEEMNKLHWFLTVREQINKKFRI